MYIEFLILELTSKTQNNKQKPSEMIRAEFLNFLLLAKYVTESFSIGKINIVGFFRFYID